MPRKYTPRSVDERIDPDRIKWIRYHAGEDLGRVDQREFGRMVCGAAQTTVSRWEKGHKQPSVRHRARIREIETGIEREMERRRRARSIATSPTTRKFKRLIGEGL